MNDTAAFCCQSPCAWVCYGILAIGVLGSSGSKKRGGGRYRSTSSSGCRSFLSVLKIVSSILGLLMMFGGRRRRGWGRRW